MMEYILNDVGRRVTERREVACEDTRSIDQLDKHNYRNISTI